MSNVPNVLSIEAAKQIYVAAVEVLGTAATVRKTGCPEHPKLDALGFDVNAWRAACEQLPELLVKLEAMLEPAMPEVLLAAIDRVVEFGPIMKATAVQVVVEFGRQTLMGLLAAGCRPDASGIAALALASQYERREVDTAAVNWPVEAGPEFRASAAKAFVAVKPGQSYEWMGETLHAEAMRLLKWCDSLETGAESIDAASEPGGKADVAPLRKESPASDRTEELKRLTPAQERAYQSWLMAEDSLGTQASDQECYSWLKDSSPLEYELPAIETWQRYVRKGRKLHGTQKHSPRANVSSRSIVPARDLMGRSGGR